MGFPASRLNLLVALAIATYFPGSTPALANPSAGWTPCPSHFAASSACENELGRAFSELRAQGREICDEVFRLEQVNASVSGGACVSSQPNPSPAQCEAPPAPESAPAISTLRTGLVQISGTHLSPRIDRLRERYYELAGQLAPGSRCGQELSRLDGELYQARHLELCPSSPAVARQSSTAPRAVAAHAPVAPARALALTQVSVPQPPYSNAPTPQRAPVVVAQPPLAPPVPSFQLATQSQVQPDFSHWPPRCAVSRMAQDSPEASFDPDAQFLKLPVDRQAHFLESCLPPGLLVDLQTKLASGTRPPQCALDAMIADARARQEKYRQKGALGRAFYYVFQRDEAEAPSTILAHPDVAFFSLRPVMREKFMAACSDASLTHVVKATSPPPRCALEALRREASEASTRTDHRSFFGRFWDDVRGDTSAADSGRVLDHSAEAFAHASDQDRARYLSACSPAELTEMLHAPPPPAASGESWPPACAVEAMTRDTEEIVSKHRQRSLFGRGLDFVFGGAPPPHAQERLDHPVPSFIALSRVQQEKYLAQCTPAAAPQCSIDALVHDVEQKQEHFRDQGIIGRLVSRLSGSAPPRDADQILLDPAKAFAGMNSRRQAQYLFECAPKWVLCSAGPEPGFFARLREKLQNMGFFGKAALVLGSALAGGILWRIRGGFLPTGSTFAARMIGVLPLAALGGLMMGPFGFLAGLMVYVTTASWGWSAYQGMTTASDFPMMMVRGLYETLGPGLVMALGGGALWYTLAGTLMGPLYWFGNRVGPNIFPKLGESGFAARGTQSAEVLTGAMLYGLFTLAALNGHGPPPAIGGPNCPAPISSLARP